MNRKQCNHKGFEPGEFTWKNLSTGDLELIAFAHRSAYRNTTHGDIVIECAELTYWIAEDCDDPGYYHFRLRVQAGSSCGITLTATPDDEFPEGAFGKAIQRPTYREIAEELLDREDY